MKRYDIMPEYGSQCDVHVVESGDGEFVDADIAQEIYNALVHAIEDPSRTQLPLKVQLKMVEAVKKADGEA